MNEETLQQLLDNYRNNEGNIISILQGLEHSFGYISEEAVAWLSKKLDIPASRFFGIATFYSQFHLRPRGKHIIAVCRGTACHLKGSEKLIERLSLELGIPLNEDTTPDYRFAIERVNCIGACGIAPVTIMDGKVRGKVTLDKLLRDVKRIKKLVG